MLSVASWVGRPGWPGYAASKAAAWSLTSALREGLRDQGTQVVAVHAGFVETDLASWVDAPKIAPEDVAQQTMHALLENRVEVLTDERTREVKANLCRPLDAEAP
ncbi:SDR family NAD(P)-dependent oxidoreductase [Streptomyces chiangmaiensis]